MSLLKLKMPFENTCSECGDVIEEGGDVYAADLNAVVSGKGVCKKHAAEEPATEPPVEEPEPVEDAPAEEPAPEPLKRRTSKAKK